MDAFVSRAEAPHVGLIRVFVGLQLFGLFGAIIMLVTVLFSSTAHRHPTWHNFIIAWIISALSYSLLFITGQLYKTTSFELCFAQTALIYAAPPATAAATLGLVLQIFFSVRSFVVGALKNERAWILFIMILPYFLHICIIIEALVITIKSPDSIRKVASSGMYCTSSNPIPGRISAGLVTLIMIPTIVLEIIIVTTLRKNWPQFRTRGHAISMIIRVLLFSLFGIFSTVLSLFFFFTVHHGSELNIALSALPAVATVIFGTQRDIIETWMFWKRRNKKPPLQLSKALPKLPHELDTPV
ncbi:hypothetical protein C8J56DRAFT_453784 [Mycena floridula]|nr:hypothetical protein C8J56DRAFT_453784 [Mycena floridula]